MLILAPSPWEQRLTDEFCLNVDLRDCYVGVECRETLEAWDRPAWISSNWVVGRTYRSLEQVVSQADTDIRELVKLVDEEMGGIAREQRQRLETAESELVDVKRRLERLYDLAETTDLDIEDFKPRIKDHRERQENLRPRRCCPSVE